jgi:prepilin-type N-terminal cleavage/methylation domain-containing protein
MDPIRRPRPPLPAGFTLIEMMMVVVIIGAMLAFGLPYFRSATKKSDARGAMDAVAALHALTKQTAVQRGRVTRLVMDRSAGTMVVVANKVSGTGVDTVGRVQNLASRFGVTFLTVPTRDTLMFTPRGLGTEAGDTRIIVYKGGFVDTLMISSAGRMIR